MFFYEFKFRTGFSLIFKKDNLKKARKTVTLTSIVGQTNSLEVSAILLCSTKEKQTQTSPNDDRFFGVLCETIPLLS